MADNKPTFHHLNNSQSQRIFWLLEELGIEYNLVLHERNPPNHPKAPFRSPDSLLATGPYGYAPLLITGAKDGSRYIPETFAIATYLIRTFDNADRFGLKDGDLIRDEVLTSQIMTNLSRLTSFMLMLDVGAIKEGDGFMKGRFSGQELRTILGHLEREFKDGPAGEFFMGKEPGRADIMLEFPISMVKQRNYLDLKEFPLLDEWLERVYARPAFKRSLEKGNGYDLNSFPKLHRL